MAAWAHQKAQTGPEIVFGKTLEILHEINNYFQGDTT